MNKAPSNLWLSFFRWYCHPDYAEDIEGDLFERFERQIELGNVSSAQWGFARDVVRLFRPGLIRPLTQNRQQIRIDMFKNYYKVAWRHILKEKFYSATNIAGLGVGMACCMFIWLYVQYELSYDRYNENLDSTYRVLQSFKSLEEGEGSDPAAEDYQVWGCAPLGPAMAEEFPEVDLVTQFTSPSDWLVRYEDNVFSESEILFADSNILKVFSWQMLSGNRETALDRPYTIVLTESFAKKYFGTEAALGKSLTMDQNLDFEVTGIIADVPVNSHFSFEALVSMGTFKQFRPGIFESWGYV
ncbi:MAG: ABC transporter permease, partial [Bacteroidota bacterium]